MDLTALTRLLQLASPSLPVGGFSYSQGLETALCTGLVTSPAEVEGWIADHLVLVLARNDLAFGWRMLLAWKAGDADAASGWNEEYVASRDGAELRAETLQMGYSLSRLLADLEGERAAPLLALRPPAFLAAWTFAAALWRIPDTEALVAWAFAWLEMQVLAYLKTGNIGQVAGQRLLGRLAALVPGAVREAEHLPDDALDTWAPGLALVSFGHEIQNGRMFRS